MNLQLHSPTTLNNFHISTDYTKYVSHIAECTYTQFRHTPPNQTYSYTALLHQLHQINFTYTTLHIHTHMSILHFPFTGNMTFPTLMNSYCSIDTKHLSDRSDNPPHKHSKSRTACKWHKSPMQSFINILHYFHFRIIVPNVCKCYKDYFPSTPIYSYPSMPPQHLVAKSSTTWGHHDIGLFFGSCWHSGRQQKQNYTVTTTMTIKTSINIWVTEYWSIYGPEVCCCCF